VSFVGKSVTADIANAIGLPRPYGVLVEEVYSNGPADAAGLRQGDVIKRIGQHEIEDVQALRFRLATRRLGDTVDLSVFRRAKILVKQLKLVPPPDSPPRNTSVLEGRHPLAGAKVANLNPALATELGIDSDAQGVIVLSIEPNSPSARYGFRDGDVILEIEGRSMGFVKDLKKFIRQPYNGWRLKLRRGGRQLNVRIG
jgi:serine protease Do